MVLIYRLQIMKTHFLHMLTVYKQINYIHKIFRALQDRITNEEKFKFSLSYIISPEIVSYHVLLFELLFLHELSLVHTRGLIKTRIKRTKNQKISEPKPS